jgi:energy-coupling factor transporter transmembrane protein EcfT
MMRIDQNPVFRKSFIPWYDSETACIIVIILMIVVFLFGFAGISVVHENVKYQEEVWTAVLLVVMSGVVLFTTTVRLIKRYIRRSSK